MAKISVKSQNTILKFLEEPTSNCIIILLVENLSSLLDTVINRCQVFELEKYDKSTLSLFADKPFEKGKTVIFFDEIQEFKELVTKKGNNYVVKQDTATAYIDAIDFNPVVNVYIENSGSMDGYVKGQTDFEQIVYNYLVNLKLAKKDKSKISNT